MSARPGRGAARAVPTLALAAGLALAGCAATLPYTPARQPAGATISADVRLTENRLRVEIESEGYRVEQAVLVRGDGAEVAPEALLPAAPRGGPTFGIGIGAGGWGSGGSYSIGTGVGIPLGGAGGGPRTVAVFRLDEAGPAPWRLRLKVVGIEPVEIVLDPGRGAAARLAPDRSR